MLTSLAIRDIVLVDRLDLTFGDGLTVLTGETGAGKSIILDALGLALGGRADRALVRNGAAHGSVTACFEPPPDHPAWPLLAEQAIEAEVEIVLRRTLGADGRSRAFVNDEPVSTGLLHRLGDQLVEVHGQDEQRGLLSPALHRHLLDAFGEHAGPVAAVREAWRLWREAVDQAERLAEEVEAARREEDYLRHRALELRDLAPVEGEEPGLAEQRSRLVNREKLSAALDEALAGIAGGGGARERLGMAERRLARSADLAPEFLRPAIEALGRALIEVGEAENALEEGLRDLDLDAGALEKVEARLFALRDAARKHRVAVDELPRLLEDTEAQLARIEHGADSLDLAREAAAAARDVYRTRAAELSALRSDAAERLAAAAMVELPPLKLERARFRVRLDPLEEGEWSAEGRERVQLEVSTNPGQPFGPIARIASGGELSRFMLALKVVLARLDPTETLIFDEIDAGIGGATADAVGERLARLALERQVLIVTHAPQVAARAHHHLTVTKRVDGGRTRIEVLELQPLERQQEIARMLAGAEVTDAARAAASSLLEKAGQR